MLNVGIQRGFRPHDFTGSIPVRGSMMCLKTFKIKSNSDFDNWDEWVMFVNENIKYAKENSTVDDYKDKCDISDLPSFHPYWRDLINKDKKVRVEDLEKKYDSCRKNPDLIKVYFNSSTALSDIRERIEKLKDEIAF